MKNFLYRLLQPKPPFFCRLGRQLVVTGIILTALLIYPLAVPAILVTAACFGLWGSFCAWLVCQLAVDTDRAFLQWIYGDADSYIPPFINRERLK